MRGSLCTIWYLSLVGRGYKKPWGYATKALACGTCSSLQAHFTCSPFGPEVREVVQALPMDSLNTSNNHCFRILRSTGMTCGDWIQLVIVPLARKGGSKASCTKLSHSEILESCSCDSLRSLHICISATHGMVHFPKTFLGLYILVVLPQKLLFSGKTCGRTSSLPLLVRDRVHRNFSFLSLLRLRFELQNHISE